MSIDQKFLSLHRNFLWSDRMRVHFDYVLQNKEKYGNKYKVESELYLFLWYGLTYVLVEGWQELKYEDKKVNELLESPNVDLLRLFRNGVFHFQEDYYDEKHFMTLLKKGENVVGWIRMLNDAFSDYFLQKIGEK